MSPIGDAGWTHQRPRSQRSSRKTLGGGIETRHVENVAEGADAERVIREFAASGSKIVFATSFGYMNCVERVARQFPNVFPAPPGCKSAKTRAPVNARFYEGRYYLNGVIAGKMKVERAPAASRSSRSPEVLQGINAFTLGAQREPERRRGRSGPTAGTTQAGRGRR